MAFPSIDPSQFGGMPDALTQGINMPPPQMSAGMFGGGSRLQNALTAAAAGFLARTRPQMASSMMEGLNQRQTLNRQAQMAMLQSNLEFQRQMELAKEQAQLKLLYPDGDFATALRQSGVVPGTPEWTQAMQTRVQNELDPAVVTPQGMMLRSQVTGALQPPSAPVGELKPYNPGGPTQPASGGFPY